jgi:hypothetical protein
VNQSRSPQDKKKKQGGFYAVCATVGVLIFLGIFYARRRASSGAVGGGSKKARKEQAASLFGVYGVDDSDHGDDDHMGNGRTIASAELGGKRQQHARF